MCICAHFSSVCQVLGRGGIQAEYLEERLVFVFHYWGGYKMAQVTLWVWMCMENCLVQWSTLHSKRTFFNPRVSHPLARTLLPSKALSLPPPRLQYPSSFLPRFPWPQSKFFMWLDWGRLEVDPCPFSSEDTCFSGG